MFSRRVKKGYRSLCGDCLPQRMPRCVVVGISRLPAASWKTRLSSLPCWHHSPNVPCVRSILHKQLSLLSKRFHHILSFSLIRYSRKPTRHFQYFRFHRQSAQSPTSALSISPSDPLEEARRSVCSPLWNGGITESPHQKDGCAADAQTSLQSQR